MVRCNRLPTCLPFYAAPLSLHHATVLRPHNTATGSLPTSTCVCRLPHHRHLLPPPYALPLPVPRSYGRACCETAPVPHFLTTALSTRRHTVLDITGGSVTYITRRTRMTLLPAHFCATTWPSRARASQPHLPTIPFTAPAAIPLLFENWTLDRCHGFFLPAPCVDASSPMTTFANTLTRTFLVVVAAVRLLPRHNAAFGHFHFCCLTGRNARSPPHCCQLTPTHLCRSHAMRAAFPLC